MRRLVKPSPALVVALAALVVALTGSAIALPGTGSVDRNDLRKNAVTKKALKKGAIVTSKIKAGAVTRPKLAAGSVDATKIVPREAPHVVGNPGEPQFANGGEGDCIWLPANSAPGYSGFNRPAFYKDQLGVVHGLGAAVNVDGPGGDQVCDPTDPNEEEDGVIFSLPAGYVPSGAAFVPGQFAAVFTPAGGATVDGTAIPGGVVWGDNIVSLEGVSYIPAG